MSISVHDVSKITGRKAMQVSPQPNWERRERSLKIIFNLNGAFESFVRIHQMNGKSAENSQKNW